MVFEMAVMTVGVLALLMRSELIPAWLGAPGLIGYAVHIVGVGAEILGLPLSLWLLIPGALFEVTLAFWLIVRGFNRAAYPGQPPAPTVPAVRRPVAAEPSSVHSTP